VRRILTRDKEEPGRGPLLVLVEQPAVNFADREAATARSSETARR
jgi:hypothetical protein